MRHIKGAYRGARVMYHMMVFNIVYSAFSFMLEHLYIYVAQISINYKAAKIEVRFILVDIYIFVLPGNRTLMSRLVVV
jgi:hypothetical protein